MVSSAWDRLTTVVAAATGLKVVAKGPPPESYYQDDTKIVVTWGDCEALLHEACHWIVATDSERQIPNLGLSGDGDPDSLSRLREEQAWGLECWLLSPFASETEVVERLTPESRASHPLHLGGYLHDRTDTLAWALGALQRSPFSMDAIRDVMRLWDREQRTARASSRSEIPVAEVSE